MSDRGWSTAVHGRLAWGSTVPREREGGEESSVQQPKRREAFVLPSSGTTEAEILGNKFRAVSSFNSHLSRCSQSSKWRIEREEGKRKAEEKEGTELRSSRSLDLPEFLRLLSETRDSGKAGWSSGPSRVTGVLL